MKIFGNSRVQGRLAADTGSFKIVGTFATDTIPSSFIAGTDASDAKTIAKNRSVVAHGQFDYVVTSQDSGISFDQATVPKASVMGFRVQHVNSKTIYTLKTDRDGSAVRGGTKIDISTDGGLNFVNAYSLSNQIVGFDMLWTNEDEAYVVGASPGAGSDTIFWRKFVRYGLAISTMSGNEAQVFPKIFKKEVGSNEFVLWGTAPNDVAGDCITAIAVKPDDPNTFIIGTHYGRLYKSTDGALTWTYVGSIGAKGTCVNRIKFVTGNSNVVYAVGTDGAIKKSSFAGNNNTWNPVLIEDASGPLVVLTRDNRIPAFNDILLPNTTDVFLVGDDHTRILKSSNSGLTWEYISSGIYSDFLPIENVKSIRAGLVNYYAAISKNKLFVARNPNILGEDDPKTIDWIEFDIPENTVDLQLVTDENPTEKDVLAYAYILTTNGLYEFSFGTYRLSVKRDFTTVVNDIPTKLIAHSYREIYIITANAKIIRGTKYVYDFNKSFRFVEETSSLTSQNLVTIHTAKTGKIFAGTDTGKIIYKETGSITNETTYSTDPVTWSEVASAITGSSHKILQVVALNNSTVFALIEDTTSLNNVLFKTTNGGTSWTQLYTYSEGIKKVIPYDESNIYAINQLGSAFYITTNGFSTVTTFIIDRTTNKFSEIFELDSARTLSQGTILFLLGGDFGIRATNLSILYPVMGPWTDNSWTLCAIAGEEGYPYWIAGGTTFAATRGGSTSLGSEPILLTSNNGGITWENAITRLKEQEPPDLGINGGGDFTFTSISEGKYLIDSNKDTFPVYASDDQASTFKKVNSNLFRQDLKYPGNSDGIRKIRFYDSNFGVAVSDITDQNDPKSFSLISITKDGGANWSYVGGPDLEGFNFNSVFIPTQSISGEYLIYVTAYPKDLSADGYVFVSNDSGNTWKTSPGWTQLPTSNDRLSYQPQDIFFVNDLTGSVTVRGSVNGSPAVELIYRTGDGGINWNPIGITDFAAGDTRGHLQFITVRKGFVAGSYGSNKYAGLFKTTDSGLSWTRLTTPYDSTSNKEVSAMHFLTEAVGVIAMGSEIWITTDSGSNWEKAHDLAYTGIVNEIKFSGNGKFGLAVGHYSATNSTSGEHFVLKSTDSGSSWTLVDSNHDYVDLEFEFDSLRNLTGQPSTLYTVAFAEKITLTEETSIIDDGGGGEDTEDPEIKGCFGVPFISASYYNFENFAYKCNPPSGSNPIYYPNSSNNIGLGKGIFGQNTNIEVARLRNKLTYGAALGVGTLGKAEYSKADTAAGFGAMDMIRNAKNNVAIGYKALSSNRSDIKTSVVNTALNIFATSSIIGINEAGSILVSNDVGDTWTTQFLSIDTASIASGSYSGSLYATKIYKANASEVFVLSNDLSGSSDLKTIISKYNKKTDSYRAVYSSSTYAVDNLSVLTPSTVYALDNTSGTFLKSTNGGNGFGTGSILNTSGNTLKSFKMYSENFGFIVGSKIWKLQSGSSVAWETSSYSGSHTLNAIDYVNASTWIAVGTSGSVYRTSNRGLNWNLVSTGLTTNNLLDVQAVGSKIVAVGESGSIIYSSNTGLTWRSGSFTGTTTGSNYGSIQEVDLIDNSTILARHLNGILKSVDGGKTWYDAAANTQFALFASPSPTGSNASFPRFEIKGLTTTRYSNDVPSTNPNYDLSLKNALTENPVEQQTIPSEIVDENVAVGSYALSSFENASRMVAIGANALKNVDINEGKTSLDSIYEDVFKAIYMGDLITGPEDLNEPQPKLAANYGQIAIGAYSQNTAINSTFNTSVGYATLYDSNESSNNTAIGFYSQHLGHNHRNTSVGVWALGLNGDLTKFAPTASVSLRGGNDNVAIGYKSLLNNLGSVRASQISQSGNIEPQRVFQSIGSRNIAIGNYAFLNASGSADTIAIGYRAVSDHGNDLSDSVFIGNYVGQAFKTKIGTYYSSSQNNDWKFTQTVAVGSRTLQNQTGYDIVAIGANALRGTQSGSNAASPDIVLNSDPVGVLAVGFFNSNILSRNDFSDFSSKKWSNSNYVKKRGDTYFIYDELTNAGKKWDENYSKSKPVSIAIASRQTAYAAIEQTTNNGTRYPLIVRTNNLSSTNGKDPIEWNVVQKPGLLKNIGPIRSIGGKSMKLNVPDTNTMYLLVKGIPGTREGQNYKSAIYKATSNNEFAGDVVDTLSFNQIIDNGRYDPEITDMHFPTATSGMAVGGTKAYISTNGGSTWSIRTVDTTNSGSNVSFNGVWMNAAGDTAYLVGTYGSIYKWNGGTGLFTKLLGASSQTKFGGDFWDTVSIAGVSTPAYFATRANDNQVYITFTDIDFFDDSFGIAIGVYPNNFGTPPQPERPTGQEMLIAITNDGGSSWQHKTITLPVMCGGGRNALGEIRPLPFGEITIIDKQKAIIGMTYGQIAYTTDGGNTWSFTDSHYKVSLKTSSGCGCNPLPITWCSDYKFFEGSSVTISGSNYEDIAQVVTIGSDAQARMPAATDNVAIGYRVQYNGTGSSDASVQIGASATLEGNTILDTVAIGKNSLYNIQYSDKNTAVGTNTLNSLLQTNATLRAMPGPVAGAGFEPSVQTDSSNNTVAGFQAGASLVAGDKNVFLGVNSGQQLNGPNVKTWGNNNVIIGANAPKTQFNIINQVALGNQQMTTHVAWGVPGVAGWIWYSDARDKADTGSFNLGLDFIRQIQPKEFKWDGRFNYVSGSPNGTYKHSGSSYGYIAQDLEAAALASGVSGSLFVMGASGSYSGSVSATGSFDIKMIKPAMVNLVAVNAIKQLDTTVTYLSSSKYTTNLGDGSNVTYPVTHSLGTRDIIAMVYSNNSNFVVYPTMSINSTNTMTVTFNTIPTTNEYRLVVMR
jgi:photosystem II stability/assembly factor-like uncharacterized protein